MINKKDINLENREMKMSNIELLNASCADQEVDV